MIMTLQEVLDFNYNGWYTGNKKITAALTQIISDHSTRGNGCGVVKMPNIKALIWITKTSRGYRVSW